MNTDELFNDSFIFYLCMEDSVADGILNLLASYYENKHEAGKGWSLPSWFFGWEELCFCKAAPLCKG